MRKSLAVLLLLGAALPALAQITPELGFNVPPYGTLNWNVPYNSNWLALDQYLSGSTSTVILGNPGPLFGGPISFSQTNGGVLFSALPTVYPNGSQLYCKDCNTNCTAGSSTGKTCFRENGVWTGVSSGGSGVTSVGLVGTANEITVTGTSPIIATGSWTLSLPSPLTLSTATNVPSGATLTIQSGGSLVCAGGSTCPGGTGSFPTNQSLGDTVRYSVYGDSKWDAAQSGMSISLGWYNDQAQGVPICYGAIGCSHPVAEGSFANVYANGTNSPGATYSAAATASTSDVIGMDVGAGANFGDWGFGNFYRLAFSWAAGNTTNVRYWLGMTAFNTGGAGCSTAPPRSTTCYATNTPNTSALVFRYSAGTDTHWQAVSINAGTATVTSTGVAVDTNPHLFEIAAAIGGGYNYYIDGVLTATITTNLPSVTAQSSLTETIIFWTGDNENTATAIAGTSYWMSMSEK
jgi:hypothetical protein